MKKLKEYSKLLFKNKFLIIVLIIFLSELFLRFYQMDLKSPFGYDQVDNAWAAKSIIADHKLPLVGMVAKGNSGIYIGPVYYYLISIFYFFTNLHPIASALFAGVTSIFTFWVIFYVSRKLFSIEVAIIAVFINTFFFPAIIFDRVQWPVNLIPGISLLIFYVLYKVTQGDVGKIIILALLVGFSFSVHFTSIFFPIIIVLTLPFFPRNKETLKYILLSFPLFVIWLVPNILYQLQQKYSGSIFTFYFQTYFHGFHLRRVMQLVGDGLIQFNPYLLNDKLAQFKFLALPLFFVNYLYKSLSRKNLVFCYLVLLWFIVPWLAFATYSGEISDYYFSMNRFVALMILSYLIYSIFKINNKLVKLLVVFVLLYFAYTNVINYLPYADNGLKKKFIEVEGAVGQNRRIEFQQGVSESYLYYYLMRKKGKNVY